MQFVILNIFLEQLLTFAPKVDISPKLTRLHQLADWSKTQ